MLDALLLLSTAAFILAGGVVGVRLLRLAARTRELPDFVVGASLFVLAAIGYPLVLLGQLGDLSLEATKTVNTLFTIVLALGETGVFFFTQRVFRRGEKWAIALASAGIAVLLYGVLAGARFIQAAPDRATLLSSESPVVWTQLGGVLVYAWTALEGFRCWEQARRRMRLGLADPLVVNRFLLWGVIGVAALLSIAPAVAFAFAGVDGAMTSPASRWCTVVGGLAAAIAMQLAFLPPARYRAWLLRGAAA